MHHLFHPALKTVATSRKELAVKTFFNLLGPLVNPANINFRYVGVYGLEVATTLQLYFAAR
jgi:anthranilate phosphoribosyltransferase